MEKKNNTAATVSTTLLIVLVIILGGIWWYSNNSYTQQYESNFMANCNATSGGNAAACACVYSALKSQYSFAQTREFEANPNSYETKSAFSSLASQCQ